MSTAGSIALIFLIVEALICALVPLAIVGASVFGMYKLRKGTERAMPKAQAFTAQVAATTRTVCDKIADPLIQAHTVPDNVRAASASAQARLKARLERWRSRP